MQTTTIIVQRHQGFRCTCDRSVYIPRAVRSGRRRVRGIMQHARTRKLPPTVRAARPTTCCMFTMLRSSLRQSLPDVSRVQSSVVSRPPVLQRLSFVRAPRYPSCNTRRTSADIARLFKPYEQPRRKGVTDARAHATEAGETRSFAQHLSHTYNIVANCASRFLPIDVLAARSRTTCTHRHGPTESDERRPSHVQRTAAQVFQSSGLPRDAAAAAAVVAMRRGARVQHGCGLRARDPRVAVRSRRPDGPHVARLHLEERGQMGGQADDRKSSRYVRNRTTVRTSRDLSHGRWGWGMRANTTPRAIRFHPSTEIDEKETQI